MDKIYDLGQRLERLLYTSVLVIIFSFIILSLSKSLAISKSINTTVNYQNIIESLNSNADGINRIKSIESDYLGYTKIEDDKKRKFEDDRIKTAHKKEKDLISENKVRRELALAPLTLSKEAEFKEDPYPNYYSSLLEINRIRHGVLLPDIKELSDSQQGYKEVITAIIKKETKFNYNDTSKLQSILESSNYDTGKLISYLNGVISKEKNKNIKILDIDTPVDFPVSIGTMQLNIPMSNIEGWAMRAVPVFLIIWIGSIFITRLFEITQLLESKKIMFFYPHILNLFNLKSKNQSFTNTGVIVSRALGGSAKDIGRLKTESVILSLFRGFLLLVMLLSMTIPSYLGFYIYLNSDSSNGWQPYVMYVFVPAFINFIQIMSCITIEAMAANKVFVIDGDNNEML